MRRFNRWIGFLVVWGIAFSSSANLSAQTTERVPLSSFESDMLILSAASPVATTTFEVNDTKLVTFDVASRMKDLTIQIQTPEGTVVNPTNAESLGVAYSTSTVDQPSGGAGGFPSPFTIAGTHSFFTFPLPMSGKYLLTIEGTIPAEEEILVFISMFSDTPLKVALTTPQRDYQLKDHIFLAAFAFKGDFPVSNAKVTVEVVSEDRPESDPTSIELKDDGKAFDPRAGDGLYSGVVPAVNLGLGNFIASATITNNSSASETFRRTASATFSITDTLAHFVGTVSHEAIDEDGDKRTDRVRLFSDVTVTKEGLYDFTARLTGENKVSVSNHRLYTLPTGAYKLSVDFTASDFRDIGTLGPYGVNELLEYLDAPRPILADERTNSIQPFTADESPARPIMYTGVHSDMGLDTNGNRKFDTLQINLDIRFEIEGIYHITGHLIDPFGRDIQGYGIV